MAATVTGPRTSRLPAHRPCPKIARRNAIRCSRAKVTVHRPRRQRTKRMYRVPRDCHRRIPVSCRQARIQDRRMTVHGNHRNRPPVHGPVRQNRTWNHVITRRCIANIGATVKAHSPPRHATAHARRPAPAKAVVEVPRSALVGQIAPWIARYPDVAEARRPTSSSRIRRDPIPRSTPHTATTHSPGPARCTSCHWRPGRSMPGWIVAVHKVGLAAPVWSAAASVSTPGRGPSSTHPRSPVRSIRTRS